MYQAKAENLGYKFDKLELGKTFLQGATFDVKQADDNALKAICSSPAAPRHYVATIDFTDSNKTTCSCGYYLSSKNRGTENRMRLCSHQVGLLIHADNGNVTVSAPVATERKPRTARNASANSQVTQAKSYSFAAKISRAIDGAIVEIADNLIEMLDDNLIPVMVGPTGCGKTSAAKKARRSLACKLNRPVGFETVGGMESYGDADLFGLRMPNRDIEGVIARAFRRARAGELVILFVDEFLRFDRRVQNTFMLALLPTSAEDAQAMGIDTDKPVYVTEAPVWGIEWAPVENIRWIFGCNPWGATVDNAFGRRVQPVYVSYSEAVLKPIEDQELAEFIKQTWQLTASGGLGLPVEYQQIASMRNGHDRTFIKRYLDKLMFTDQGQHGIVCSVLPEAERQKFTPVTE